MLVYDKVRKATPKRNQPPPAPTDTEEIKVIGGLWLNKNAKAYVGKPIQDLGPLIPLIDKIRNYHQKTRSAHCSEDVRLGTILKMSFGLDLLFWELFGFWLTFGEAGQWSVDLCR